MSKNYTGLALRHYSVKYAINALVCDKVLNAPRPSVKAMHAMLEWKFVRGPKLDLQYNKLNSSTIVYISLMS